MRLNLRRFDFVLLGATLVLLVFGIAMVYSATQGVASYEDYPLRQAIYGVIGLLLLLSIAAFDYRLLTSLQWPIYVGVLAALGAVAVVGQVRGGASGWFDAGIVFIQPAEFGKVLFIINHVFEQVKPENPVPCRKVYINNFFYQHFTLKPVINQVFDCNYF